ncbi:hypothetical protein QWY31_00430 [Cytophagales bacterium LB-30]|uniref:ATP-binding cassette domain-containing protein n=1 Tax=Shiella aurantiaca TaxID=3058365 RepID=A0ABT8F1N8_9BACT|nr:hypothetical protein [Shiella aurantiaca]MDN4163941.1 hypothetical protein [Shiella aurantiaca]
MGVLSIDNYSKKYGERLILAIPHVQLEEGVHWLKGENGAGKSTLFLVNRGHYSF